MKRREFLQSSAAASLVLGAGSWISSCTNKTRVSPNIIFILADDLGYGDLSCYGQKIIKTPNLDRLAAQGMRFTDHYAGSTVCAPSRGSLMTGFHTGHAWVRGNSEVKPMGQYPLRARDRTVAELLKSAGYTTALIGKWGLGGPDSSGHPNKKGFDYFFGYLCQRHAHNYYPEFLFRNSERIPQEGNRIENPRADGAGKAVDKSQYSHDLFADEALEFVEANKNRPFFLYLALTIPHANNEAGKEGMEVPDYGEYRDLDWPDAQKGHAAMISRMDRDIGRLLDRLKELGLDEKTIVFFSSDNGPHREGGADPAFFQSSGPFRGIKRTLYEGGIRVPLIARWPGRIPAGSVSSHLSAFWDFLPTACDLAGLVVPSGLDGISFRRELLGGSQRRHDSLYWEFHESKTTLQAVRFGGWKAVRRDPDGEIELYNLAEDPGESKNAAGHNPKELDQASRLMEKARTQSERWPLKRGSDRQG